MRYAIILLFEGSLLGEGYLDCVHKSKHSTPALFLMYSFIIITILLLLNMLIALMGKTFDTVWESAMEESGYQFARRVYNWFEQQDMPPPFNILSWPSHLVHLFVFKPLVMGVNGCELLRKKSVTTCCPSPYNTLNNGKKEETEAKRIFISAFKDTPTFKSVGIAEAILEEGAFDEKMKKRLGQYEKGTLNKKVMSETGMRSKFKRIAEIADQAAENMEKRFGSYDSTAELIDRGVAAVIKELKGK